MKIFKLLGPSALDLEIRLLRPYADFTANDIDDRQFECLNKDSNDCLNGFLRLLINRFVYYYCIFSRLMLHYSNEMFI